MINIKTFRRFCVICLEAEFRFCIIIIWLNVSNTAFNIRRRVIWRVCVLRRVFSCRALNTLHALRPLRASCARLPLLSLRPSFALFAFEIVKRKIKRSRRRSTASRYDNRRSANTAINRSSSASNNGRFASSTAARLNINVSCLSVYAGNRIRRRVVRAVEIALNGIF